MNSPLSILNSSLNFYAVVCKKTAEEILRDKASQLVLGNKSSKYGKAFDGLYDKFSKLKPSREFLPRTLLSRVKNGGGIITHNLAIQRARELLGGAKAGLFTVSPQGVKPVYIGTKGKKKGMRLIARNNKGAKSAKQLTGSGRFLGLVKKDGEVVLNKQSLAVALEIRNRRAGIGYTAAAVLPRRYRTILKRKKGVNYKSGMAKGMSSTDIPITHQKEKVLVQNKTGTTLGKGELTINAQTNSFKLTLYTSTMQKGGARRLADMVLKSMNEDISQYLRRKGLVQ